MISVIDDFVSKEKQDELLSFVTDARLPFFMNEKTVSELDVWKDRYTKDCIQLTHTMVSNGVPNPSWSFFEVLWNEFMNQTNIRKPIKRVKANITFPIAGHSQTYTGAHVDHMHQGGVTAIYYMNDSDGDTLFFEKPESKHSIPSIGLKQIMSIKAKKGRLVYFNSDILHSGMLPSNSKFRCVVNLNMYEDSKNG